MRSVSKSIAIIGEGETEWFYIDALRQAKRYPFKIAPDFPQHSDISHLKKLVDSCLSKGYDYVVCLIDMDRILGNIQERKRYEAFRGEYTKKKFQDRVWVLETNPCTEFGFLLHFLPVFPLKEYTSQQEVICELRHHLLEYEKTKRYFIRSGCFKKLFEDDALNTALVNAEHLYNSIQWDIPHNYAYSQVHRLFDLLSNLNN